MLFLDAIKICFSKYVVFSGRASRSEYWWFTLFTLVIGFVIAKFVPLLGAIFYLAVLLPSLAVGARRLHDTNRTAWWLLLYLLPLIGVIVLLVFFVLESTPGQNDYGENPLES